MKHFPAIWSITQCSQLLEEAFIKALNWSDGGTRRLHFFQPQYCIRNPTLWWKEFLFLRSMKMEGCWRSWAGIRVEPSLFLHIFAFIFLFPSYSSFQRIQAGLEDRREIRMKCKGHSFSFLNVLEKDVGHHRDYSLDLLYAPHFQRKAVSPRSTGRRGKVEIRA